MVKLTSLLGALLCAVIAAGCKDFAQTPANANDEGKVVQPATQVPPGTAPGISFTIDTTEPYPNHRGAFTTVGGRVEFAAGHGRLDITNVRQSPSVTANRIAVARPLGRVGDYYLFDSTGFTLVQPASRTYREFKFSRFTLWYEKGVIPGEEMIREGAPRIDTMSLRDARTNEHRAFTLRTHVEQWHPEGTYKRIARAWMEIDDAPPGDAAVIRFFGPTAALANTPDGLSGIHPDSLQVTSILIVGKLVNGSAPLVLTAGHRFTRLVNANIDTSRFHVPVGFTKTSSNKAGRTDAIGPKTE